MKILYYSDCMFFAGCENMLINFWDSPALRSEFDVCFYYRHSERYEQGLKRRAKLDFPVHPLGFRDPSEVLPASGKWPRALRRAVRFGSRLLFTAPLFVFEIFTLRRVFTAEAPDLVHINNGGYPAALSARAAAIAAWLAGVPRVVMVVNNLAEGYGDALRWLEFPLDRLVVRATTRFVTGSRAAAARLQEVLRLPSGQVQSIHNGIRLRAPSESVPETRRRLGIGDFQGTVFGIIGLMEPRKGHVVLLRAMRELAREHPQLAAQTCLLIEGDGPLSDELQTFVAEANIGRQCKFVGTEDNVMNLFMAIDVLILSSVSHEDFPNVTLEAMGCRRAVIASRIAGTPEQVLEDETGYLVPPNDSSALAAAIRRFCVDPELKHRLGANGLRRFAHHFVPEVAVGQYLKLYRQLLHGVRSETPET